ncbi:hypothetical protein LK541_26185, partial [Bacillus cereus]|nr:hypothetical protein [Bacillus cereus]
LLADTCDGEKPRRGNNWRCVWIGFGGLRGRRARSGKVRAFAYSGLRLALFLIECALGIELQQFLHHPRNWLA